MKDETSVLSYLRWAGILLIILLLVLSLVWAGEKKLVKPSPRDKCPVCGMFVAKYPDFVALIVFKDGTNAFFDGVKDMMKCYFNLKKYQPSKKPEDIESAYVTDYYSLEWVRGLDAFYVLGSDVYGPMGRELIPLRTEADAKEFMKDHKGKSILRFKDITPETIRGLD